MSQGLRGGGIFPPSISTSSAVRFAIALGSSAMPGGGPTELVAVATSFNAMRDRLAEQDNRRTHMLAAISHDLRTPLAKIRLEMAMLPQVPAES